MSRLTSLQVGDQHSFSSVLRQALNPGREMVPLRFHMQYFVYVRPTWLAELCFDFSQRHPKRFGKVSSVFQS